MFFFWESFTSADDLEASEESGTISSKAIGVEGSFLNSLSKNSCSEFSDF